MVRAALEYRRQLNRLRATVHIRSELANAHECLHEELRFEAHKLHWLSLWLETNQLLLCIEQIQQLFLHRLGRCAHPSSVSAYQHDSTAHHRWIWIQQYIQHRAITVDINRNSCLPARHSDVLKSANNELLQHVLFTLFLLSFFFYYFRMIISFFFLYSNWLFKQLGQRRSYASVRVHEGRWVIVRVYQGNVCMREDHLR